MARATKKQTVADAYTGVAALTIVRLKDRTQAYVYAGAAVPGDVEDAELLRLADEGFIAPVAASAKRSKPNSTTASSTPANSTTTGSSASG
ncbi:MAG: hypothetical protein ACTMIY_03115, partial [Microbacterium gubbeenense]